MRRMILGMMAVAGLAMTAAAQQVGAGPGFEVRTFGGLYVPVGPISDDLKTAEMVGGQVAREMNDNVHLLASFGFTHGHNKFANIHDDRTFIYQYDAGIELNDRAAFGDGWLFRPFLGAGAGARTYDFMSSGMGSSTCTAAYGSVGMELQQRRAALRFDTRSYLTCYESPVSGLKRTRADYMLSLGLVYHIR